MRNYHCGDILYAFFQEHWRESQNKLAEKMGKRPNYFSELWKSSDLSTKKIREVMQALGVEEYRFYDKLFPDHLQLKGEISSTVNPTAIAMEKLRLDSSGGREAELVSQVKTLERLIEEKERLVQEVRERADLYKTLYESCKKQK